MSQDKILKVENLTVSFKTHGGIVRAVSDVSFDLSQGETLAIVGESGCGKTVTSKSIMQLLPDDSSIIDKEKSKIIYNGINLLENTEKEMSKIRGKEISMIFQDPMTSLNPTMRNGNQIAESLIIHEGKSNREALQEAQNMLGIVKIPNPEERMKQYPFEFSGGMRQRTMIAIALASQPKILIADEPTTALDVTIQAQIMDLIKTLQNKLNTGVILVTHDLGVVASVADRILVMYAGKVVETGTVSEIFYSPKHPYSYALLQSVPTLKTQNKGQLYSLDGRPPDLTVQHEGCLFAPRCKYAMRICQKMMGPEVIFSDTQKTNCWLHHPKADIHGVPDILVGRGDNSGR